MSKIISVYGHTENKCPTKLPADIKDAKEQLKEYCKTKVHFLAEVKSVTAKECHHVHETCENNDIQFNLHVDAGPCCAEMCTPFDFQGTIFEIRDCMKESSLLVRDIAREVLVYLLTDLERSHTPEKQYAVPVGYAMKGYSMSNEVARKMVDDVLQDCYFGGLYCPVVSFDGQWYKLAVRSEKDEPLTLLQLMKDVYKAAKVMKKSEIIKQFKQLNSVQVKSQEEAFSMIDHSVRISENGEFIGPIDVWKKKYTPYLLQTSANVKALLQKKKCVKEHVNGSNESEDQQLDVLNELPGEVIERIEEDLLENLNHVSASVVQGGVAPDLFQSDLSEDLVALFDIEETNSIAGSHDQMETDITLPAQRAQIEESLETCEMHEDTLSQDSAADALLTNMMNVLQTDSSVKRKKWAGITLQELKESTKSIENIEHSFYKTELQVCLRSFSDHLQKNQIHFAVSWNKSKLVDFFYNFLHQPEKLVPQRRRYRMLSLKTLCLTAISKISKEILNVVQAEHTYPLQEEKWRQDMVFTNPTHIQGLNTDIIWYSKPEYIEQRFTHLFCLLDCHHLLTNARAKCCSSGIPSAGIDKNAWIKVAQEDGCISRALVEDLVDKQSNAYAQKTFSVEVETAMRKLQYDSTANFCKLIREWYNAEDEPGLAAAERCQRRLNLRAWLYSNIEIGKFPPPGSHVNGIPIVMFEGLMTNIERRIQLFPFVRKGTYNVRALGSLESENFFGAFQDLDLIAGLCVL